MKERDYKELTHVIIRSDKFQDLRGESASWRPMKTNGFVLVCMLAGRYKDQEKPVFQLESKVKKKTNISA